MLNKRGFTLIELLVVITIIAILSAIGIIVYSSVTMKARDARRKLDLQNIAQALEVYYQKNNRYPIAAWAHSNSANWIIDTAAPPIQLVPAYISTLPQDPKGNGGDPYSVGNPWGYLYSASDYTGCPSAGQYYILATVLENPNDPDRAEEKGYKWCDGQVLTESPAGWSKNTYVITSK